MPVSCMSLQSQAEEYAAHSSPDQTPSHRQCELHHITLTEATLASECITNTVNLKSLVHTYSSLGQLYMLSDVSKTLTHERAVLTSSVLFKKRSRR